jgi:hypothetical protein
MAAALCVPIPKEVPAQKPIAYLNSNGHAYALPGIGGLLPVPSTMEPPPKPVEPESPIALITAVKELAKRCGGLSKLKELVAILGTVHTSCPEHHGQCWDQHYQVRNNDQR